MNIGVPKETAEGEKRVSFVPESIARMKRTAFHVQAGAGKEAGLDDSDYTASGAVVEKDAEELYAASDFVVKVQPQTAKEAAMMKKRAYVLSFL